MSGQFLAGRHHEANQGRVLIKLNGYLSILYSRDLKADEYDDVTRNWSSCGGLYASTGLRISRATSSAPEPTELISTDEGSYPPSGCSRAVMNMTRG